MCGIFAATASGNIVPMLVHGLEHLEYRGYDSAGIAVIDKAGQLQRLRIIGKVAVLAQALQDDATAARITGNIGIAHTRWATHGIPAVVNAHPMVAQQQIALVHNGIIENYEQLRTKLLGLGYHFTSQTDTEVIVHYLHWQLMQTGDLLSAIQNTITVLQGSYALAIVTIAQPQTLIAVKNGSPLVIGLGQRANFVASDVLALLAITKDFIYLEDGNIAMITADNLTVYDSHGKQLQLPLHHIGEQYDAMELGCYPYFMRKEIAEQATALTACFMGRINQHSLSNLAFTQELQTCFAKVRHVQLVACGTSYHAALTAKYWLEAIARVAVNVEIASEFRYRQPVIQEQTLFVVLSQSGETADTLAALKLAKELNYLHTLAICNVPQSTITREAEHVFFMRAGMEIGVASTKAFTTQLLSLLLLTLAITKSQNNLSLAYETQVISALHGLPAQVAAIAANDQYIINLARHFLDKDHALFIGRGEFYPIAMEGALKLKEISYIHAEAYPGGELKHGPLALVDSKMPVIALAPQQDILFDKMKANISAVAARGGILYVLTDVPQQFGDIGAHIINMPVVPAIVAPIVYSIPLQLLAYHVAVLKGANVDQPRNLAKSVTVE